MRFPHMSISGPRVGGNGLYKNRYNHSRTYAKLALRGCNEVDFFSIIRVFLAFGHNFDTIV